MKKKTLVCLVEERSAEAMLEVLIPALFGDAIERYQIIAFEGKQDLDKNVLRKIQYWQESDSYFLVLRDQDSGDCQKIKKQLQDKLSASGKMDRILIRIACRELETFYLGDLEAVEQGLSIKNLSKQQSHKKFRHPDRLNNAKQELIKLTNGRYQVISGSRLIAPYLIREGADNTSTSFQVLVEGLRCLLA